MNLPRPLAIIAILVSHLSAGAAESQHYRIEHHGATTASGGGTTGGAYQNQGITGETGGVAQGSAYLAKAGFAGQIYLANSLGAFAPSTEIAENSALQLGARAVMDDDSVLSLDPSSVQWQAASGPIASITPAGLLTGGVVHTDRLALVAARYQGLDSELALIVKNAGNDDFGLYAADGIDDAWQVQYFGENNPDAAPDRDPSGSGHDNLFKFTAGLDPLDSMSRFTLVPEYDHTRRRMRLTLGPCFATRLYQVMASTDMIHWQRVLLLQQEESGDPEKRTVVDIEASQPAKYYRVIITIRDLPEKPAVTASGK